MTSTPNASPPASEQTGSAKSLRVPPLIFCLCLGVIGWFLPPPSGLSQEGFRIFVLFVVTVIGLITKPLPMGAVAMIALTAGLLTHLMTLKQAFGAFQNDVPWLVVFALFIAKGFNVTGLGKRIAYFFAALLGRKSLGLSYGLMVTDLILAPAIPSVTGRSAGIVYPILQNIASSYHSFPHTDSARKLGAFLTVTAFQVTVITSTMFMTAMAANPILAVLTRTENLHITWSNWAVAALLPGIASLLLVPWIIYKLYPPEIKETPFAQENAKAALKALGPFKRSEWVMAATTLILLTLWIFGAEWGISAVTAAMVGLSLLLITGVLEWKSLVKIDTAWETFFWFSILILLAGLLKDYGVLHWVTETVQVHFKGLRWEYAFPILAGIYFYTHYFFASSTAHVTSMYPAFLSLSIALGTPSMLAAFILIFFSNLFGGLTHYSLAPAPLLFGAGYVDIKNWWKIGFLVSLVNIAIWSTLGLLWWKYLGYW